MHYFLALYVGTCYNLGMAQINITSASGETIRTIHEFRFVCGCANRDCPRATLFQAVIKLGAVIEELSDDEVETSDAGEQMDIARRAYMAAAKDCDGSGPGLSRLMPPLSGLTYEPDFRDARNDAAMDAAKEARLGY